MNPLFSAIREAYGGDDAVVENLSTFPGVIAYSRRWLADGGVETRDLKAALEALRERVEVAAQAEAENLEMNPNIEDELREPVESCYECYQTVGQALERMVEDLEDLELFKTGLSLMEEATEILVGARRQIILWMQKGDPVCMRCGAGPEVECSCGAARLIPDLEFYLDETNLRAELSSEHVAIFEAYLEVLSGQGKLSRLFARLKQLESVIADHAFTTKEAQDQEELGEAGDAVMRQLELTQKGILRMRAVEDSLHCSDLHQGWKMIFESAVNMQSLVPALAEQTGASFGDTDDQVSFSDG